MNARVIGEEIPLGNSESPHLSRVFMVMRAVPPVGAPIGQSIHLTQAEADAACQPGDWVSPHICSTPAETVRRVSARLAARDARMGLNQVAA